MINFLELDTCDTLKMKGKFERNKAYLKVTNDSTRFIVLDAKWTVAILDIRSLGYHKTQ